MLTQSSGFRCFGKGDRRITPTIPRVDTQSQVRLITSLPSNIQTDQTSRSHEGQPTKEASAARKRLLEAFAQYDALSKRISQLPCPDGPTSSQYRVQMAIHARANLFLQQNMFPLQVRSSIHPLPLSMKTLADDPSSRCPNRRRPRNLHLRKVNQRLTQILNWPLRCNLCSSKRRCWSHTWKRQKLAGNLRMPKPSRRTW
jgi:hypothetical protein